MKKCRKCGAENKNENRFCHNCGTRLDSVKTDSNSTKGIFKRINNSNGFARIAVFIIVAFIICLVIGFALYAFFGDATSSYSENAETRHPDDLNGLDMDCDGALSFEEADGYAPDIDNSDLSQFFDEADKNDNGLLKGGEFDWYLVKIDRHYKDLEKQKKAEENAAHEKSKQSSNSIPTVKLGKCPSCGSDASNMYDYYDEFDRPYYECTVCGYWTYDESEFYGE